MKKSITINAPEGMVIDEKALENNKIEFIPENAVLPTMWELERDKKYYYVSSSSSADSFENPKSCADNRHMLPTKELADAVIALCQLLVMRDMYNGDWKADWNTSENKYCIDRSKVIFVNACYSHTPRILAFKTSALRNEFSKNFKELIETAKPLL